LPTGTARITYYLCNSNLRPHQWPPPQARSCDHCNSKRRLVGKPRSVQPIALLYYQLLPQRAWHRARTNGRGEVGRRVAACAAYRIDSALYTRPDLETSERRRGTPTLSSSMPTPRDSAFYCYIDVVVFACWARASWFHRRAVARLSTYQPPWTALLRSSCIRPSVERLSLFQTTYKFSKARRDMAQ